MVSEKPEPSYEKLTRDFLMGSKLKTGLKLSITKDSKYEMPKI